MTSTFDSAAGNGTVRSHGLRPIIVVVAIAAVIVGMSPAHAQQTLPETPAQVSPEPGTEARSGGEGGSDTSAPQSGASVAGRQSVPTAQRVGGGEQMQGGAATGASHRELPSELSLWGMFLGADIVVKAVMVGLAAASFLVWTVWLAKWVQLWLGRRRLRRDIAAISGQSSIEAAIAAMPDGPSLAQKMLVSAVSERDASGGLLQPLSLQRISSHLTDLELRVSRDVRGGMSFLATVGATGPFIGLFGTVWGIMNSFIGISKSQTTSLAVVAPGIAEALLATAIGLVAAIPAVILYNNLGKGIGGFRRLARETRGEVERIASREMERQQRSRKFPSLAAAAE